MQNKRYCHYCDKETLQISQFIKYLKSGREVWICQVCKDPVELNEEKP